MEAISLCIGEKNKRYASRELAVCREGEVSRHDPRLTISIQWRASSSMFIYSSQSRIIEVNEDNRIGLLNRRLLPTRIISFVIMEESPKLMKTPISSMLVVWSTTHNVSPWKI